MTPGTRVRVLLNSGKDYYKAIEAEGEITRVVAEEFVYEVRIGNELRLYVAEGMERV